jgi:hypothetical protein
MTYQISDLIVESLNDSPVDVEKIFDELMEDRIAEAILLRKQTLASALVSESAEPDEDEDDDVEFDDTDFDVDDDDDTDFGEIDLDDIDFDDIEGFDEDDD